MSMSAGPGRQGLKSEINVTPLVDVVLVLLIIFMVVTPMLPPGKDVKLPVATHGRESSAPALVVSLSSTRELSLEHDGAMDDAAFTQSLARKLRPDPSRRILLKADRALHRGDVRRVLALTRKAGAEGISLAVVTR